MTPEYINDQWTEELLLLMFRMRAKRLARMSNPSKKYDMVRDSDLFESIGFEPELV